jgi:hypothetical protein
MPVLGVPSATEENQIPAKSTSFANFTGKINDGSVNSGSLQTSITQSLYRWHTMVRMVTRGHTVIQVSNLEPANLARVIPHASSEQDAAHGFERTDRRASC